MLSQQQQGAVVAAMKKAALRSSYIYRQDFAQMAAAPKVLSTHALVHL